MADIRMVGRYPDSDSSAVHNGYVKDRVDQNSVPEAKIRSHVRSKIENYKKPSDVDTAASTRVLKSSVTTLSQQGLYQKSQVGKPYGLTPLVNGYIPSGNQGNLSDGFREPRGRIEHNITSSSYFGSLWSVVLTWSYGPTGYWMPLCWGSAEVKPTAGDNMATGAIFGEIIDSSNTVIARGIGGNARDFWDHLVLSPSFGKTYYGSQTFRFRVRTNGPTQGMITSYRNSINMSAVQV